MTVTTEKIYSGPYVGDSISTKFSVDIPYIEPEHLIVTLDDKELVVDTNYEVVDGAVIFYTPPAKGQEVLIKRKTPLTQLADYVQGDEFPAESHERALDKQMMATQELQFQADRFLQSADIEDSRELLTIPTIGNRRNKILSFDGGGKASALSVSSGLEVKEGSLKAKPGDGLDFGANGEIKVQKITLDQIEKNKGDIAGFQDGVNNALDAASRAETSSNNALEAGNAAKASAEDAKREANKLAQGLNDLDVVKGAITPATIEEIQNGTIGKLVDAAGLRGRIATASDITNGAIGKFVDAEGLAVAFTSKKSGSGYTKLPNGLIVQWGSISLGTVGNYNPMAIGGATWYTNYHMINLPIAFNTATFAVVTNCLCGTFSSQGNEAWKKVSCNTSGSPSQFTVAVSSSALGAGVYISYVAIGH